MKAASITATGSPDVLVFDDVEDLPVGPSDIAVAVAAAAVNPVDLKTRSGFLDIDLQFPAVLGWDVAGVVSAAGSDVDRFTVGDRVVGMIAQPVHRYGTYAERVTADAGLFASAPTTIALEHAAALPLAGLTALQTLDKIDLSAPSNVLVTGAAGAVGRIVVQVLLSRGHRVGAIARGTDADDLHTLGVAAVFTDGTVKPRTWDAVVDTAGLASSIDAVRDGGQFVSIDDNAQPTPTRNIVPLKSYVDQDGDRLTEIVELVDTGKLTVPVGRSYALSDIQNAHSDFARGGLRGKVLVIP